MGGPEHRWRTDCAKLHNPVNVDGDRGGGGHSFIEVDFFLSQHHISEVMHTGQLKLDKPHN